MGVKDRVTIELYVDDQGTLKIVNARKSVEDLGQAGKQSFDGQSAAAENYAATLAKQVGIYALITAAAYKLEQAVVGGLKAGLQAVDDYRLHTIGIAATLTDLADSGVSSQTAYARNIAYSRDMYDELQLAAARHFATGGEMIAAWNIMSQKGIVLQKDQIDNLGVIVDKVKLLTVGQTSSIQIAQELRAMLSGQSRATDQMAMLLKDRYGAAWEGIVEKHRKAGDLLAWLASEFRGLAAASDDIVGTYTAQKATLETMLSIVGRDGLEGMYGDIVGWLKLANDYLRDHRDEIGGGIAQGWTAVKELAEGTYGAIKLIYDIVSAPITWTINISIQGAEWLARGGQNIGAETGLGILAGDDPYGYGAQAAAQREKLQSWMAESNYDTKAFRSQISEGWGGIAKALDLGVKDIKAAQERADRELGGLAKLGTVGKSLYREGLFISTDFDTDVGWLGQLPPKTKPGAGLGKDKKGGSGRDTTDTLENLILQLRQEEAKLAEGAFAGVASAYEKTVSKIRRLAMDEQQLKEGLLAASEWKAAKEQKITDDFNLKYLGQMHQTTALQIAEDQKRLDSVKGNLGLEQKAREIMNQHALERSQKLALAENQQVKGYYDSLAASSILITDQIAWKEKSWQLEKEISRAQLEQWFIGKDITAAQKDNYRGLLALTNQAKEYNLARQRMENNKGLTGWAYERVKSENQKNNWADFMAGSESFITDAFTQGIQGAASKTKVDFMEIAESMAVTFGLNVVKSGIHKAFTGIAESVLGASGVGQPGFSPAKPLYVVDVGQKGVGDRAKELSGGGRAPSFETRAQKIGYTMRGDQSWVDQTKQLKTYDKLMDQMYKGQSKDLGGIRKLQSSFWADNRRDTSAYSRMQNQMIDQNQELFKAEYLTNYTDAMGNTVNSLTSIWSIGQDAMTIAGVAGETQRYATMASFGLQAVTLMYDMVAKGTLAKAWAASAAAYSSTWEFLGFPAAVVVAPVMAALAFAGTLAAGSGGGAGGGGGSTPQISMPGAVNLGGQQYHTGGVVAHSGWLVAHSGLNLDERHVIAQVGEGIIKRDTMAAYARQGISFDDLNSGRLPFFSGGRLAGPPASGNSGGTTYNDNKQATIHVHMNGDIHAYDMTPQEAEKFVDRKIIPAIEKKLGNRARSLLS